MINNATSRDTIAIEDGVHVIYKQLTEGNDSVDVPFHTMKDLFMWAVCLGYQQNKRRPLTGKRQTIFRLAQLTSQVDIPLIKAIAIASRGNVNVLLNQDEILSIAEEYANAGIHELRASILDEYGQPLWNLVNLINRTVG